MVSYPSVE